MGMRRAHDGGIKLIGELEIVEIAALPAQQARVLAPQYRLSDGKFAHRRTMASWIYDIRIRTAGGGYAASLDVKPSASDRVSAQKPGMKRCDVCFFCAWRWALVSPARPPTIIRPMPIRLVVPFAPGGAVDGWRG